MVRKYMAINLIQILVMKNSLKNVLLHRYCYVKKDRGRIYLILFKKKIDILQLSK